MTAEQNYMLLREIEANREFILLAYKQNPLLLARAELRIRQLFGLPDAERVPPSASITQTGGG